MKVLARRTLMLAAAAAFLSGFLSAAPARAADPAADRKKVFFLAGGASHGFGAHDHVAGCMLLADRLSQVPGFEGVVVKGWPQDESALDGAAAVVIYCDGGPRHMAIPHIKTLDQLSAKGVGIGCLHYAVEVPADEGGDYWLKWMGGYFEAFWSVNPHWQARFNALPRHPVTRGVKPFATHDEWYYNMRFRDGMKGVTPILTAIPPDDTRRKGNDAHGGNPEVFSHRGQNRPEHVLWLSENENGSRGFGSTGGHVHWNWAQDDWRNVVLNSVVWIAKGEVPEGGVDSKRPTLDEMMLNNDEKVPDNFDKAATQKRIDALNQPFTPTDAAAVK
jgi:type 1 glutamine amidotransferase